MESAYDANVNNLSTTASIPPHLLPATSTSIGHNPDYYLRKEASKFEIKAHKYMQPKRIDDYNRKLAKSKPKVCTCTIKDLNTVTNSEQETEDGQFNDSKTDSDESVIIKEGCVSLRSHCEVYNQLRYGQIKYEQGEPRKYGQLWTEIWLERHWSNQWSNCPNDVQPRAEVQSDHPNRRKKTKAKKSKIPKCQKPDWVNNNWFTKWYYKENRHLFDPNFEW